MMEKPEKYIEVEGSGTRINLSYVVWLETELKAAEDHAATMEHCAKERVPFEVFVKLAHDSDMCADVQCIDGDYCTKDNCPLTKEV